jgi:hypothetical protein
MRRAIAVAALVVSLGPVAARAQEWSAAQREVWQYEQTMWDL